MEYRTLGRTGLRVSVIGLGTMVHAGHFGPMENSGSGLIFAIRWPRVSFSFRKPL